MATLNQIAYAIAHTLGAMNDHVLREKIKYSALNLRALYIRQDLASNPLSKTYLQSLGAVPIVCADIASECTDLSVGIKASMVIHRTKDKVPTPVRTKGGESFYSVNSIDKQTLYQEVEPHLISAFSFTKYASLSYKYFYLNGFIYIVNLPNRNIKYINVIGVWENPQDLASICNDCYSDDAEFPIPLDMLPRLERDLLQLYQNQKPVEDEEVRINNN
jgi:hypothetical protein